MESSAKTSNTVFQSRCNRTPLSQLNKVDSVWRESRTYARSAIQALELKKQQQQQENMQRHSRNTAGAATKPVLLADERWARAYIKAFPSFKFYFDGIEDLTRRRLEEKVKILGATVEQFFSAKCTHIVTGRPVPEESKPLAQKKPENASRDGDIFEIAHKHKIKIWSVDKLQNRILPILFDNLKHHELPNDHLQHRPKPQELPRMLQQEKVFGPSTSKRGEHHGPNFVRFNGHFIFVEDVTGSYRPIVVKEYPPCDDPNKHTPAWPTLRKNKGNKSPFVREGHSDNRQDDGQVAKKEEKPVEVTQQLRPKTELPAARPNLKPAMSLRALNNEQVEKLEVHNSGFAESKASLGTPSLNASGMHQFGTSRVVSTSGSAVHGLPQPLPPGENINRLDRRTITNIKANDSPLAVHNKAKADAQVNAQAAIPQASKRQKGVLGKKRPPPKNFCENCRQRFYDLKEAKPRHREYASNAENFADLDKIIELTRRRYKPNLPSVKAVSRSEVIDGPLPEDEIPDTQEPEPSSTFVVDDSWEKFADIVW
ncbi:hypothetical protein INT43_001651 [Umbelopsis isabellina]|uniref:DBF4-type domain-containing protein n=1 Tax=Mortierella isabellina TaxID=91625 RepID=A0A8H7UDC6_MORIS|nr:hypothetical protein INT43_001651 [Umbelopsis isabellina]